MSVKARYRRSGLGVVAAAAALSLSLSACQGSDTQQSQDSSQASAGGTPVAGGTLSIAQAADLQPNVVLAQRQGNGSWVANVLETLVQYDEAGDPQPLLATDWELAADGMSISLTLRDDVTFHDGKPLTAEDVKFTYEYAGTPESAAQLGFIARSFAGIDVVSPTELTIRFSQRTPNIFDFLDQISILDEATIGGLADASNINGTGPFTFESWSPGSEARLVRNEDYWGGDVPLEAIEIAVITDSTALLNAVRSQRSQVGYGMNPVDIPPFESNPDYTVATLPPSAYPLGFDVTKPPFDTKEARQAVNYAIDRERIADQVFGASGVVTDLYWREASPSYPEDLATHYTYDPDRAEELVEEAGLAGTSFEITVNGLPQATSIAEVVRNNLEAVGLDPTITVLDSPTFNERQLAGDLGQVFMPTHGLVALDPVTIMGMLPSLRENNPSKFWTDEYVELRQAVQNATDEAEATDALKALTEYMLDEAFSVVIVQAEGQTVIANEVSDLEFTGRGYVQAREAFLAD